MFSAMNCGLSACLVHPWFAYLIVDLMSLALQILRTLLSLICVFLAIVFYAIGVRLIGPGNAALVNTLEPVLACIFGHFIIGDVLTRIMLIGSALVVAAVLITNLPERRK